MFLIWEKLTTDERLLECMHRFESQINEALNNAVAKYVRKGRTYCTTMSLTNRIMIVMGVHNLGYFGYWSRVLASMELYLSTSLGNHLKQKDEKKNYKRKYESQPERKVKRMKTAHEKMKNELKKQIADFKKGKTYGSGVAIETEQNLPLFVVEDDKKLKPLKSQRCPHIGCFGRNHATSSSKACRYYGCGSNEEYLLKLENYLKEKYPDEYGEYNKAKIDGNRWKELTF